MKAYGHYRRDMLSCRYGCCQSKGGKIFNYRERSDRAAAKRARRAGKTEVAHEI